MRFSQTFVIGLILISFLLGIWLYPKLPDTMASHWNISGSVDGTMPKFWGVFILPFVLVAIWLLLTFLPRIDPMRKNAAGFEKPFDLFMVGLVVFLFYIYTLCLIWNFGVNFNMNQAIAPGFALLLFIISVLLEGAKRNWFIGIRTPWTMSSDEVWRKTHKLGAILFKVSAVLALLAMFLPGSLVFLLLGPILISVVVTVVYSYVIYKKA